ncbi:MAG: NAD(P)/FAD-dependent oxidoreductase, partial [Streptosporangiaceae bacterium]
MPTRIVVIGGSAGGMGAAGAAKQQDPHAQVMVFTDLADVAYSPCGIPYVHGREIPDFDRLVLQSSEFYAEQGLDIRYETHVESVDLASREVTVRDSGTAVEALTGPGKVESVRTSAAELPADIVVMGTKKLPNTRLAREAGIKTGSTGGIIVDPGMATSAEGVYAAGDCIEVP